MELQSEFELANGSSYLTLKDELWGVYCEYIAKIDYHIMRLDFMSLFTCKTGLLILVTVDS